MSRSWKLVFGLFIILFIASSGVYIWQISKSQQSAGVVMQPSVQLPEFKTYSDKSFTVRYPIAYELTQEKSGIVTIAGPNGKIMIGDYDFAAAPEPTFEMSQAQKDQFPKDIKYHGYDARVASALFYTTGDDNTMRELKSIQDTIITTLVVTKNYVSNKDIFGFDYPTDWTVSEDASTIDVYPSSTPRTNYFSISKLSSRFSPEPLQYYIDERKLKKTDLLISGSDVYADGVSSTKKDALGYYLFSNRDNVYQIYGQYNLPEVKAIIASIKFPPADPANKIVYRNDQYKFSLDLPDAWLGYQVVQENNVGENKITLLRFNLNGEQIFTVGVFKIDEFATVDYIKNPTIYNAKFAENTTSVFTSLTNQDVSKYMLPRSNEVSDILKSFKPY